MNGGRDKYKRAVLSEYIKAKNINITFLQETHSDVIDEIEWKMWWEGNIFFSHGSNVSGGVAILFAKDLNMKVISLREIEKGRVLVVQVEIMGLIFVFVNIYAPNKGAERINLFKKLDDGLKVVDKNECLVLGGDWNCTLDFTMDRNGEEPYPPSANVLSNIIRDYELVDIWREQHLKTRQFSWVKVSGEHFSAARLDRFYICKNNSNRVLKSVISPNGFSDHHLSLIELSLKKSRSHSFYWHFNVKLLYDVTFCEKFELLWENWKERKNDYDNIMQWWEVGKTQIRLFCQNYTAHNNSIIKKKISELEREIEQLEMNAINSNMADEGGLGKKKKALGTLLHEHAKGALIRARFSFLRDMDAPSSFFFKLEKKEMERKQMFYLKYPNGTLTTDPKDMRMLARNFYEELFGAQKCDISCIDLLLNGIPKLNDEQRKELDSKIKMEELSEAVNQLSLGKAPGIDGLPAEFYRKFWKILNEDILEVYRASFENGKLPTSCRRAVISLLPKKGDLGFLKNWRPVALLCTDYKILAKVFSNRLKEYLSFLIQENQTYCVPKRTIMDNLFLLRDVIDLACMDNQDIGIFSIDQEKAFDRVDHGYLFNTLKAFGIGEFFLSGIKLLYTEASAMLKVGGGLSQPVQINRGIRQGCPLSGQLYALAIEPLLCQIKKNLHGFFVNGWKERPIKVSAYADDISVFIKNENDIRVLKESLDLYEKASSARVNWSKSEGFIIGDWQERPPPVLPGGVKWGKEGLKFLGVYLGNETFVKKNWEGMLEKVSEKLSRWKWVLPKLSYRGRVLVINNLIASMFWHKMTVLNPPNDIVSGIQRMLIDFFWSGYHWTKAAVLYLPVNEGGHGLIDIKSRIMTFRLQVAQRLLYFGETMWTDTACALLQKVDIFKYDKQLFLMRLADLNLSGTSSFYHSVLKAWTLVFKVDRDLSSLGNWIKHEPIFCNPLIEVKELNLNSLRSIMAKACCTKISDLRTDTNWKSPEEMCQLTDIKSIRFMKMILEKVFLFLPSAFRQFLEVNELTTTENGKYDEFPELRISAAVEDKSEDDSILDFKIPQLTNFEEVSKKAIYLTSVKVLYHTVLKMHRESKWTDIFGIDSSPRGCWRSLYKTPIEKRTADLQWRIVHWAIATNKHVAHFDSAVTKKCVFCDDEETLDHIFLYCFRLRGLFFILEDLVGRLGEVFSMVNFIFGPKYIAGRRNKISLINYIVGEAKLAIWLARKRKLRNENFVYPEVIFKDLITARIRAEFAFYKLTNNVLTFKEFWGIDAVLCIVNEDESLEIVL